MTVLPLFRGLPMLVLVAALLVEGAVYAEATSEPQDEAQQPEPSPAPQSPPSADDSATEEPPPVVEDDKITVPVSEAVQAAAELMRPAGALLDQVVAAMVRLNPEVFKDGDLRHVTFSAPLNIPSSEKILTENPAGLPGLLVELDRVAEASPAAGSDVGSDAGSSAVSRQQPDADYETPREVAAAEEAIMPAPSMPAGKGPGFSGWLVILGLSTLLALSLLWMLLRTRAAVGGRRGYRPLPASRRVLRHTVGKTSSTDESSTVADLSGDQEMLQQFNLPADYLDYNDVGVLLQRVVAEFPDALRQVIQLMHFFQQRSDSVNFLRQHQRLLENYFYQRHPEVWSIINQYAVELGLELNATSSKTNSAMLEAKLLELQSRVKMAEHARREAERRASIAEQEIRDAEQEASEAELALREMQLRLDFGEVESK
ncbi:MAG: hypothetical protein ABFR19_06295 [Pseudomonadota bacterium]